MPVRKVHLKQGNNTTQGNQTRHPSAILPQAACDGSVTYQSIKSSTWKCDLLFKLCIGTDTSQEKMSNQCIRFFFQKFMNSNIDMSDLLSINQSWVSWIVLCFECVSIKIARLMFFPHKIFYSSFGACFWFENACFLGYLNNSQKILFKNK